MANPTSTESKLPAHASVVVIGGGVMGCSTLYHLGKMGVSDAILLERSELTSGTTWHSAAQVRALRSTRSMTDLIRYSVDLYRRLEEETGQATGWINKGSLSIATNPDRVTHIKRQQGLAELFDVRAQFVSAGEANERWPLMNTDDVIGAVWSPDDGRVGPSDLCAALVKGARASGARIFENTAVIGIETDAGRIRAVQTAQGRIACDAIALCAGLWSRQAGAMAGVDLPIWPCEHFYLLTGPMEEVQGNLPTLSDHDNHLYMRDDSGGLLVGCFEPVGKAISPDRIGDDFAFQLLPEDWDHFEPMMHHAMKRLPILERAPIKTLLNGPESFTPDGSFLLGETAQTQGLFLGCGMNSVGVATGGGAGMALAQCIVNGAPTADLGEVEPNRFAHCFNDVQALAQRVPEVLGKHYEITYPNRQWRSARQLRLTPLHKQWQAHNACFGQFAGWERPLYFQATNPSAPTFGRPDWFEQVALEVKQATTGVAIFDQSSLGKIDVHGVDASKFLNRVCTNDMTRAPGKVIYTSMLDERGGIESDLTAIRIASDHYRLYTGTISVARDMGWLRRHRDTDAVTLTDVTEQFAVLAVMGPKANDALAALGAEHIDQIRFFNAPVVTVAGVDVLAARLSYVGESGFELTCRVADAVTLFDALQAQGAKPAGVFAQSSMRIEKRFLAYGHDIDTDLSPLQAGLSFTVDWKTEFVGKDALTQQQSAGQKSQIVSLVFDDVDAVPLGDEPVLCDGKIVGKTTSAAFGFRIGKPVAIALMQKSFLVDTNKALQVNVAGTHYSAQIRAD